MINLELAEYDLETGKFVRFLEVGEDFVYGGDFVGVYPQTALQAIRKCTIFSSDNFYKFEKDEKDPLNRFDGLFNGRTYGKGRFVLIINNQDNINKNIEYDGYEDVFIYTLGTDIETNFIEPENLHENPELYEKINK